VVDNASTDDTCRRVEAFLALRAVRLLANSQNRGFGAAVNQGAQQASGDVLLIVNPDAIPDTGAVAAMLRCMQATAADAVGGALLQADGQPDRGFTFRRLPTVPALAFEGLLINQLWPDNTVNRRYRCLEANYSEQQQVEQPAGACLAVKRSAWEKIGGFDEQFFPVWFEDVDFCKRLLETGFRIYYCPEARFRHSGGHSVGRLSFREKQLFWYGNMLRYARKHLSKTQVLLLRIAIVGGMLLRSVGAVLGRGAARRRESLDAYWAVITDTLKPNR
jgi:GT2 family glycosyltransferase